MTVDNAHSAGRPDDLERVVAITDARELPSAVLTAITAAIACDTATFGYAGSAQVAARWHDPRRREALRPRARPLTLTVSFALPDHRVAEITLHRDRDGFTDADVARAADIGRRLGQLMSFASLWRAEPSPAETRPGDVHLTPREIRVLDLVTDGLTDLAIARRLGVAESTVSKHLEHIFRKLGVTNRVAAAMSLHHAGH